MRLDDLYLSDVSSWVPIVRNLVMLKPSQYNVVDFYVVIYPKQCYNIRGDPFDFFGGGVWKIGSRWNISFCLAATVEIFFLPVTPW